MGWVLGQYEALAALRWVVGAVGVGVGVDEHG
jgi:hypothetical protein